MVTTFVIDSDFQAIIDQIMVTNVRKIAQNSTNVFFGLKYLFTDINGTNIIMDIVIHATVFSMNNYVF